MLRRIHVARHQFGLWFRDQDLRELLRPGSYWIWTDCHNQIRIVDTLTCRFEHALLDVLIQDERLREHLEVIDVQDGQRVLFWKEDRLEAILDPGRHVYWKKPYRLKFELRELSEGTFEHERMDIVLAHPDARRHLHGIYVQAEERVLLYRDGRFVDLLMPGRHVFWMLSGQWTWKEIDLREQVSDVSGQEILTSDKVSLRTNLLVTWAVTDPRKVQAVVSDHKQAIYREAQLALRVAIGERTLDQLLASKEAVGREIAARLAERVAQFGIGIRSVGLRDLILPGDMKTIQNQVMEARKQAEANLIRRREETAAARSQANTARLLAENPALARMKELEALQGILAGSKTTFLLGRGDLVEQIQTLIPSRDQA